MTSVPEGFAGLELDDSPSIDKILFASDSNPFAQKPRSVLFSPFNPLSASNALFASTSLKRTQEIERTAQESDDDDENQYSDEENDASQTSEEPQRRTQQPAASKAPRVTPVSQNVTVKPTVKKKRLIVAKLSMDEVPEKQSELEKEIEDLESKYEQCDDSKERSRLKLMMRHREQMLDKLDEHLEMLLMGKGLKQERGLAQTSQTSSTRVQQPLQQDVALLKKTVADLQKNGNQAEEHNKQLAIQQLQAIAEKNKSDEVIALQKTHIALLTKNNEEKECALKKLQDEKQRLSENILTLETANRDLIGECQTLNQEIARYKKEIDDLIDDGLSLNNVINTLYTRIDGQQEEIERLNDELSAIQEINRREHESRMALRQPSQQTPQRVIGAPILPQQVLQARTASQTFVSPSGQYRSGQSPKQRKV